MLIARDYSRKSAAKVQQILHIRKKNDYFLFFLHIFSQNIWSYQKKAVPLHSLLETRAYMVVIAQLAEHRIVVPSVVGSSPTIHPKKTSKLDVFFIFSELLCKYILCLYCNVRTILPSTYRLVSDAYRK